MYLNVILFAVTNSTSKGNSFVEAITSNIWAILIGVLITVVGGIVLTLVIDRHKAPRLAFETRGKRIDAHSEKIGFYVSVNKKGVDVSTPFCNGIQYDWEDDNGKTVPTRDLRVGDKPASFYPFVVRAVWLQPPQFKSVDTRAVTLKREGGSMDASDYQGGVYFTFYEAKALKPFYWLFCPIELGQKSAHLLDLFGSSVDFEAKVKVVAKGVDVGSRDYTKEIGLTALNVIGLEEETASFDFSFGGLAKA